MQEVTELWQLQENIAELERGKLSAEDADEFRALIKRGTCFVPYISKEGMAFAPSRFVGYVGNSLETHADNAGRHGRDTNNALSRLLESRPYANTKLEAHYLAYCAKIGITPSAGGSFGKQRKFWITPDIIDLLDFGIENEINNDPNIGETEKSQIIKARVGQGIFREKLISYWGACCLTKCDTRSILRASHIKPWRESNNTERLDVFNGLLLSPNMDALFDRGLISFGNNGSIMISPLVSEKARGALGVLHNMKISVRPEHAEYLEWHRENLFMSAAA